MRENSAFQRFQPKTQTLCRVTASGTADTVFNVPIPDPRLRTRVSVLYIPNAGQYPESGFSGNTIYLTEGETEDSGVSGLIIPTTLVEGTISAGAIVPSTIPAAAGLLGYSREFVTIGEWITGHCHFETAGPIVEGSWVLQVRYAPVGVRFTPDEWDQITRQCTPAIVGGVVVTA